MLIEQLHAQTQGWAAGTVLLLEQEEASVPTVPRVNGTVQEVLFDYFAGEVFERGAKEAQAILLKTAFLSQVSASMAVALTGEPQAERFLDGLYRMSASWAAWVSPGRRDPPLPPPR